MEPQRIKISDIQKNVDIPQCTRCVYIAVITHDNGKKELVAEYGKGDLVGIVSCRVLT